MEVLPFGPMQQQVIGNLGFHDRPRRRSGKEHNIVLFQVTAKYVTAQRFI